MPLVVIPDVGEQMIVARRVEQLGAGRYLAQAEATPDAIRGAVQTVLSDGRYRQQADRIRQSFLACGGPAQGAEVIRGYVRGRT